MKYIVLMLLFIQTATAELGSGLMALQMNDEELLKTLETQQIPSLDFLIKYVKTRDEAIKNIIESTSVEASSIESLCRDNFENPELCISRYLINRDKALKVIMSKNVQNQIADCEIVIQYIKRREQSLEKVRAGERDEITTFCEANPDKCEDFLKRREAALKIVRDGTYIIYNIGFKIGEQFCTDISDMVEKFKK